MRGYRQVQAGKFQIRLLQEPESGLSLPFNLRPGQDVEPGVYEGGFKLWEAALDTLQFLVERPDKYPLEGREVLDLGCGHGLLGIYALLAGARHVTFADYNQEVLSAATEPNLRLNLEAPNYGLAAGDWACLEVPCVDVLLCSEVLYRPEFYRPVLGVAARLLRPGGLMVTGNKAYYFGVGGCTEDFRAELQNWPELELL
jgi:2-polyprenyl-3-methyl-5-hydroxy-6-metoxy-1,4-benzoquinol methylase